MLRLHVLGVVLGFVKDVHFPRPAFRILCGFTNLWMTME
jgi:hypothetical protein